MSHWYSPPPSLSPLFCHMWMPYRRKWPITELPPPKQYRSQLTFVPAHRSHCLFHPCIRFMNRHTTKWRGRGKKDTRRNETAFDSLPLFFLFFFVTSTINIRNSCRIIFWNWNDERRSRCSGLERKKERKKETADGTRLYSPALPVSKRIRDRMYPSRGVHKMRRVSWMIIFSEHEPRFFQFHLPLPRLEYLTYQACK